MGHWLQNNSKVKFTRVSNLEEEKKTLHFDAKLVLFGRFYIYLYTVYIHIYYLDVNFVQSEIEALHPISLASSLQSSTPILLSEW